MISEESDLDFEDLDTMELVDLWEEPMPDARRDDLLEIIRRRGYRVASLPTPPSSDAPVVSTAPTVEEHDKKKVQRGIQTILVLGILHLVLGGLVGFFQAREYQAILDSYQGKASQEVVSVDGMGMTVEDATALFELEKILVLVIPVGIGLAFLAFYRLARVKTQLALFLALFFYLGLKGVGIFLLDPELDSGRATSGIGITLIVLVSLISAISHGQRLQGSDS